MAHKDHFFSGSGQEEGKAGATLHVLQDGCRIFKKSLFFINDPSESQSPGVNICLYFFPQGREKFSYVLILGKGF